MFIFDLSKQRALALVVKGIINIKFKS